jgi:predicted aldo/keto reductase-like oxidoreductase
MYDNITPPHPPPPPSVTLIEKRRYKDTNEYISLLGFGGLRLPLLENSKQEIDEKKLYEMVDYAIYHGVNYFDTAYGYHNGKSETFLGEALSRHPRESFNFATKMPLATIHTESAVERIFQDQLRKCKVDYFDFYLLHNVNKTDWNVIDTYRVYEYLKEKQKQGLIRYLGFSFHDKPELLMETVNKYDWDFAQIQLNYMDWDLQNAKTQYQILKDRGIPITVMEPVRGGILATLCDKSIEILKAANNEVSIASWAIRYAASFPEVLTVLSGMSNIPQLQDNIGTIENFKPLDKEEYKVIEKSLSVYRESATIPCSACRYCMDCPAGVDIPSVLAIYNNYLLDKEKNHARKEFRFRYYILRDDRQAHHCINCGKCTKHCPQHINIPYWMEVITVLSKKITYVPKIRLMLSRIKRKIKDYLKI